MPSPAVAEIERELAAIGERRAAQKAEEKSLRDDTRAALRKAQGVIPTARAAKLAGLNRSTVYELYLGDEDDAEGSRRRSPPSG